MRRTISSRIFVIINSEINDCFWSQSIYFSGIFDAAEASEASIISPSRSIQLCISPRRSQDKQTNCQVCLSIHAHTKTPKLLSRTLSNLWFPHTGWDTYDWNLNYWLAQTYVGSDVNKTHTDSSLWRFKTTNMSSEVLNKGIKSLRHTTSSYKYVFSCPRKSFVNTHTLLWMVFFNTFSCERIF